MVLVVHNVGYENMGTCEHVRAVRLNSTLATQQHWQRITARLDNDSHYRSAKMQPTQQQQQQQHNRGYSSVRARVVHIVIAINTNTRMAYNSYS